MIYQTCRAFLPLFFVLACGSATEKSNETKDTKEMDSRTEIRMKQYMIQGKQLYLTYCANCHQQNGQGLARLYPPLAGADYLLEDLPRAACIIKNGKTDPITVNGVEYTQMMPGNPSLTPLEVAEILTYITNTWGNEAGMSSTRDVTRWLEDCN